MDLVFTVFDLVKVKKTGCRGYVVGSHGRFVLVEFPRNENRIYYLPNELILLKRLFSPSL